MVMVRNLVKVGNREIKKRYIGNKLIFEDLPDKTEILSGEEIYTDKADDSVMHVEIDGKSYQEDEPSPDNPSEIHSLNDLDVVSGKDVRNIIAKTNMEFGSFNYVTGVNQYNEMFKRTSQLIPINPSSRYYVWHNLIPKDGTNRIEIAWTFYDVFELAISGGSNLYINDNDIFINTPQNASFVKIRFGLNQKSWDNEKYLMVESDVKKSYSLAPEDISESDNHPLIDKINLLLSEPLRSVGNVKDRLYRDSDGLWKVERNVGEISTWNNNFFRFTQEETNGVYRFNYDGPENNNSAYNRDNHNGDYLQSSHFSVGPDLRPFNANEMYPNGSRVFHISFDINNQYGITTSPLTVSEYFNSNGVQVIYQLAEPTIETLDQELQDKLNNLRSFQGSNYIYTIINDKTDILPTVAENLKPTLHATFKSKGWYDYYLKTLLK